jgi:acetyl esterase/lipase
MIGMYISSQTATFNLQVLTLPPPDHILGRPSVQFRKIQVLSVLAIWSIYLAKGSRHGPPYLRRLSRRLFGRITPWQTLLLTLLYLYTARNFSTLAGLESPEPLAGMYTHSYFRATWVTTALDAGFWTAMRIRRKWLRDLASVVFTGYYLVAAEQADEKVRRVRGVLTVEHLRCSWNKGTESPYLRFATALLRPRLMKYPPRAIRIPRPAGSDYREPVKGWLYFDGPLSALRGHDKVVLDIPGGGFVAMDPRNHDDKLMAWAGKTGLPVLSLDYGKAPEWPYPYALNECFDVYRTIAASRGRCIGFSGERFPRILLAGDSAGGNLAAATTLMIIEGNEKKDLALPLPEGLILIYPGLDLNISSWISDEQMALIQDRKMRSLNKGIRRQKSMQYTHLAGTPHPSEGEEEVDDSPPLPQRSSTSRPTTPNSFTHPAPPPTAPSPTSLNAAATSSTTAAASSTTPPTRLATSSLLSYFSDRILSPSMMRAMIILYIGPFARPDFSKDYFLSPLLAPDSLLEKFPKCYFLTGERDPMVDDTVLMAGRVRRAKARRAERLRVEGEGEGRGHGQFKGMGQGGGLRKEDEEGDVVEVVLVPGISHGFLQFVSLFPEGWRYIFRVGRWIEEIFEASDDRAMEREKAGAVGGKRHHRRKLTEGSTDEDGAGGFLEMSMTSTRRRKAASAAAATAANARGRRASFDATAGAIAMDPSDGDRERKERLLREQVEEKTGAAGRQGSSAGRGRGRGRGEMRRKKSLVALASEEDLLGRRMAGLVAPLTRRGGGDVVEEG